MTTKSTTARPKSRQRVATGVHDARAAELTPEANGDARNGARQNGPSDVIRGLSLLVRQCVASGGATSSAACGAVDLGAVAQTCSGPLVTAWRCRLLVADLPRHVHGQGLRTRAVRCNNSPARQAAGVR